MDVVLVDELDQPLGVMEKMEAHEKAVLHRAFSIFIFNSRREMLLQQRALNKYHSGGLWTNACCSHPLPGEVVEEAAARRLGEELGFQTELKKAFDFIYKAAFDNGLTEHEFDHVFVGQFEGDMQLNPDEVAQVAYVSMSEIKQRMEAEPETFTVWFRIAFPLVEQWLSAATYFNQVADGQKPVIL